MKIGIPCETKTDEKRVALTPGSCAEIISLTGAQICMEQGAGRYAGFSDKEYETLGIAILPSAKELFSQSDLIVKVKEPQVPELKLLEKRHTLFCFLHLGGNPDLTASLLEIGLEAFAFETVSVIGQRGKTPCLAPMSQIAGRLAVINGGRFLQSCYSGRGILLGGLTEEYPQKPSPQNGCVTIIGAGVAGSSAAHLAARMGCRVRVLDISTDRLDALQEHLPVIETIPSNENSIAETLPDTDLLIGAVYLFGKTAPHLVSETMMKSLPAGAVAVDIAIDQGGCFEVSRPCTHSQPVFDHEGRIISAITNLPAAVPRTASEALSKAISPYVVQLALSKPDAGLMTGLNVSGGKLKIALA